MKTFKLKSTIDPDGHLRLDLPTNLPIGEVQLLLVIDTSQASAPVYQFDDIAGILQWHGDALAVQRGLRDEW